MMKFSSIIIIVLGLLIGAYALNIPAFMAGQYLILSVILLVIGVGLFIYSRKKNKSEK